MLRVLRSGWLTTGSEARAFEQEFARAVGAPHAAAVSSATAGLHLALEAAGVGSGARVVTTPYTFTATAEVIRYLGADPLFVDVREVDLNIDPRLVEQALQQNQDVRAVVPVHIGGHPCDMRRICAAAAQHGAAVIEDAAHAFPATLDERALGTWGTAGVYSFYATKTITTGEGGMVVSSDENLMKRVATMRQHGIDREVWDRYTARRPSWEYEVIDAGFKYNLPDLLAAIGRVQLGRAAAFLARRREISERYLDSLAGCRWLELPSRSAESSWHLFIVRIAPGKHPPNRDSVLGHLADRGIGVSVHYRPLHLMPYYRDRYGLKPDDFPVSSDAYRRVFSLPIYPVLTDDEVERVIRAVQAAGRSATG